MKFPATPLVHPASVMRGRHILGPVQVAYLKRLAKGGPPAPAPDTDPPGCNPDPTLEELALFVETACKPGSWISLDIENAGPHLICCGFMLARGELGQPCYPYGVCFRFRREGGDPWWPTEAEHLEAVRLMYVLLAYPASTKVGHFSTQHDLPFLLDLGFAVHGPLLDTSVLCHAVHSELPKGLQFLATLFCGAPRWKDIPDEKETDTKPKEESDT